MKQIAVTIPDNKQELFIELMKNISFVTNVEAIEATDNIVIPEVKNSSIEPIENYIKDPDSYLNWVEKLKGI